MFGSPGLFAWLRSGLLWRTFFLLALTITVSMSAWVAVYQLSERTPKANQVAAKVVSIVTITRAALTHSAPDRVRELLFTLASNEGLRIYSLEPTDRIEPLPDDPLNPEIEASVRRQLGAHTKFGSKVNDMAGFWVSFRIDGDDYWLMLDRDPVESNGWQILVWAGVTLLVALLASVFISSLINQPIARLAAAARAIGRGQHAEPLPESGPREIREANRSFNQMVTDLEQVETDRAVILAGISHDLRTPITRVTLEVEMAPLSDTVRRDMLADLAQMDAIIGQFLDYARPSDAGGFAEIDLTRLLREAAEDASRFADVRMGAGLEDGVKVRGNAVELRRVLANLVENARRYGKTAESGIAELSIRMQTEGRHVVIEFGDRGPGIAAEDEERLLRPFTRADEARGQANGAGLGLAIVDRVIRRHGGTVRLENRPGGGLGVFITLPL